MVVLSITLANSEAINLLKNSVLENWMYIKKSCLEFQSTQDSFFNFFFLFSIYKMVDSMEIFKCQSLNVNIGIVMKNPEMLKFVSDHLKTKKMCDHAVTKLPYLLRYVPD